MDLEIKQAPYVETQMAELGVVETYRSGEQPEDHLHREFKPRQVSMIAIAGAIGTGLIIGSGTALARGGPASLFLAYTFTGTLILFVMSALGEMSTFLPMDKGFSGYATRMVDSAFGFAVGWNYFSKYVIVLPNNLTAAGIIIQYWRPDLNISIWIAIFLVVFLFLNLFHVSVFGEAEFYMSSVKILVLVVLILTCFIIALGGQPSHVRLGFSAWQEPGAFAPYLKHGSLGRFLGFWAAIVQSCFAYTGTEVVGIAFGETPNPRKNIPKAIRQTAYRIIFFYILGVLVLGMCVPYNNKLLSNANKAKTSAAASPFVIAIRLALIQHLPDIVNACLLVFVLSAANSDIYIASRTLFGLAKDGFAPALFKKTSSNGVPIRAVCFSSLFAMLGFMNVSKSSSTVFEYFVSLVTVFGTLNWISLLTSYICFRQGMKAQGISDSALPYRGFLQPYGAYFALAIVILITIFQGYTAFIPKFDLTKFITSYIGIAIYLVNICVWKIWHRTSRVQGKTMDLSSDRDRFADEARLAEESEKADRGLLSRSLKAIRTPFSSKSV